MKLAIGRVQRSRLDVRRTRRRRPAKYAHKIPFIVKINHNELLTLPNKFDQVLFGTVKEARNLGAVASARRYTLSDEVGNAR